MEKNPLEELKAHLMQTDEAFRQLVNDPRFQDRPMILETPKEDGDNDDMDTVNLNILRDLLR